MHYREIVEEFPRVEGPPRSKGLHVSDIIRDMVPHNTWENNLFMEVGFIWERALSLAFGEELANRPGEIVKDGIAMSPDGMDWENWVLEEYKSTWKSSRHLPVDNEYWMRQTQAYCLALGTCVVRMRILYVMGNYAGSGPQYKVYEIHFTSRELEENWQAILNHARHKSWL